MARRFYLTDVFEHGPFTGNPLATVVDADGLTSDEMLRITRGFNLSETTFLMGGSERDGFRVRIFGLDGEMPFAGHPTLGSAWLIRERIERLTGRVVELDLRVGRIPVTFEDDGVLWMRQRAPEFGAEVPRDEVADALGVAVADLDGVHPPQRVSTGLEFLVVPLRSMDALERCRVRRSDWGAFVFCRGGYDEGQSIAARMIALRPGGHFEDPATGSANGCLAAYLARHAYMGSDTVDLRVGQGYAIDRPSTLHLRAGPGEAGLEVRVGGRVRLVAQGELFV
jgi:trans-2,3-dihydro-3-hydroxyanthranilate isomerase